MKRFFIIAAVLAFLSIPMRGDNHPLCDSILTRLENYIAGKDAKIGVGIIIDGNDTVTVNGDRPFPMLSVYKFPQALAVADYCVRHNMSFDDTISIAATEIKANTYSPMRDKYGVKPLRLPVSELLAYSIQLSDNNACDILFRLTGGPATVDSVLHEWGYRSIAVRSTEDEMHQDIDLCYLNSSTPIEMASLLDRLNTQLRHVSPEYRHIAYLMETCATGADRLAAPLMKDKESGLIVIGHKTGTGDKNPQQRIIGTNDVGYINFTDGHRYAIAVFISDSAYDFASTASVIAAISDIVYTEIKNTRTTDHR